MEEVDKKLLLKTHLYDILENYYVNNDIITYEFRSIDTLIINHSHYNIKKWHRVEFILYLDEFIIKFYNNDDMEKSYHLPYVFIDFFNIILEDEK